MRARFAGYLTAVTDAVGDCAPIAALAWPLRASGHHAGAAVIAALGLVFLGAYAQVKSSALGYRVRAAWAGAPERSLVLSIALLVGSLPGLEAALWLIAASGLIAAARTTTAVWKHRDRGRETG